MSSFRRWKEERTRHHIYLEQLKVTQNLSNGVGLNGVTLEGRNGSSERFRQDRPDSVGDRRTSNGKKIDGFPWVIVRLALLVAGAAVWFWVYLALKTS